MSIKTDVFKNAYMELGEVERREILKLIYEYKATPMKERMYISGKPKIRTKVKIKLS